LKPFNNLQRAVGGAAIYQYNLGAYGYASHAPFNISLFIFADDERRYWKHKRPSNVILYKTANN
jgi:hypothetical protein